MKRETKGWSKERRAKQAENMRKTKPWRHATGPKTEAGKAASSQNALTRGLHTATMRELRRALNLHKAYLKALH